MSALKTVFLISIAFLSALCSGCKRTDSLLQDWRPGALYSIANGDGKFGIAKVLVVKPETVHVRVYKQKFTIRPASIDPQSLTLGSIYDKDGFGIGHLPLSQTEFKSWKPIFLTQQSVSQEELDGYEMWKQQSGKSF